MKLYRTAVGIVVEHEAVVRVVEGVEWDDIMACDDPAPLLARVLQNAHESGPESLAAASLRAPIGTQEVWAAGVTYFRSRTARMEEAKAGGGGDFYDRVYSAPRPELFFKATARRVVGPGQPVRVRSDSRWSVPEPELALAINARGRIIGYTIGNDMSARDIEGENPLYLPQAKVYTESCALGPCLLLTSDGLPPETAIELQIRRAETVAFAGSTTLASLKRGVQELADYLFRDNVFPSGCILLTGTGIVPPDDFTLQSGDV
ncbi:MAG TPA: fumarylacetoacetate hydrolase family protein, partial [Vicinamibacterales bacterium]|nr:fumarylacetoacetate hydrolase family protein [Vicinamibacterales bacterium]